MEQRAPSYGGRPSHEEADGADSPPAVPRLGKATPGSAYSRHVSPSTALAFATAPPQAHAQTLSSSSRSPLSTTRRLRRSRLSCSSLPARCHKLLAQWRRQRSSGARGGLGACWTQAGLAARGLALSLRCSAYGGNAAVCSLAALALLACVLWIGLRGAGPAGVGVRSSFSARLHPTEALSLPAAMSHSSLFPSPSYPLLAPFPGYDPGFSVALEDEEDAYQRLLRERVCSVSDLACSVTALPLSPYPATQAAALSAASSLHANGAQASDAPRRLAYLLLSNAGFVDMAMNLLCSADALAIPRHLWLIVAADRESFRFFTLRGFNTVLLHEPRLSHSQQQQQQRSADAGARGEREAERPPEAEDAAGPGAVASLFPAPVAAAAVGADGSEGSSSWATSTHININREKIPLLHSLLQLNVDVLLFDADLVLLHPLERLFPSSQPSDLSIMFDYPYGVVPELFGSELLKCLTSRALSFHAPCSYLWELNGGFFLLRASPLTVRLVQDMWEWLQQRPEENDQDALRVVLRERFFKRQMAFIRDDGSAWPPLSAPSAALSPPSSDGRVSVRYLSPLRAPNGGLFFLEGAAQYREEALRVGVAEPDVVHLNWIIGYGRKERIAREHGLWFVVGESHRGRCSTLHALMARQRRADAEARGADASSDRLIAHRNTTYPRLSPSTLDAAARASLASSLAASDGPTAMPLYSASLSSSPLLLLFASPKPLTSFLRLPSHRAKDEDGWGDAPGADEMSGAQKAELLQDNARQVDAALLVLRSWFGLSDAALALSHVLLFSADPSHRRLADALSFDLITDYGHDSYGAPKLHSLFRSAEYIAARRDIPFLLYANGDIALGLDALETAVALHSYAFPEMLAVGRRHDLNTHSLQALEPRLREEAEQLSRLIREEGEDGERHVAAPPANLSRELTDALFHALSVKARASSNVEALDYFLFTRALWDWQTVPRFLLGRIAFDNWLLHWANARKSCVVVDASATLTALHMSHDLQLSSMQPRGMTNVRLAGEPSRRGLGSLAHVAFRTARLDDGSIRVVRQRPESGHLRLLYDSAEDAAVWYRSRPVLAVVTVDAAFLTVFANWLLTWRKARANSVAGLLVLSTHPQVSAFARAQALPHFELAQGEKAVSALNGEPTSYLQIISLRSKALLFLLEFGYDVLNAHVDTVWLDDPFTIISAHAGNAHGDSDHSVPTVSGAVGERATRPMSSAAAEWLADDLDLVAFSYEESEAACGARPTNVSVGGLFLRHTPETLRTWRRVSAQYAALVSQATMPRMVNVQRTNEDWYLQYELSENDQLSFAVVCTDPNAHARRGRSFLDYRHGALIDAAAVERRVQAAGMWLLGPDVRDAFFRSSLAPRTAPLRRLADFEEPPTAAALPPLSSAEIEAVRSVATRSGSSLSVLGLHADNAHSAAVQAWLTRAQSLELQHILVLADAAELLHTAALRGALSGFQTLPLPASPSSAQSSALPLTARLLQLLRAGVRVLLVNADSVWFEQPLHVLEQQSREQACDVYAHVGRSHRVEDDGPLSAFEPTNASLALLGLAHRCYQAELERRLTQGAGEDGVGGAPQSVPSMSLPFRCVSSAADALQAAGLLSVCALDVDLFPSGHRLFESGEALDSGVWPVVSPARFVHPRSGRVKEFVEGWEHWAPQTAIQGPDARRQQRTADAANADDARQQRPQSPYPADHSVCPPSSLDASLRPHFTLLIKVLSYTRAASLQRLLQSLLVAEYGGDRVHLEISVDALSPSGPSQSSNASWADERAAHRSVVEASSAFAWPYGSKRFLVHDAHQGLVGQWLSAWLPAEDDDTTFVLVLEDDLEVSPVFYAFLKQAICRYYFDPREFDPHLYGISLQAQRTVVGHSRKTEQALQHELARRKRAQRQAEQQAAAAAAVNGSSEASEAAAALPLSFAPLELSSVVNMSGALSGHFLYRYQLVGTWGLLLFPQHWRAFVLWYKEKSAAGGGASAFSPCVPFLESSAWWARRPLAVWSAWLIRFTFERGWYCLYANSNHGGGGDALAINHRERGENFGATQVHAHAAPLPYPVPCATLRAAVAVSSRCTHPHSTLPARPRAVLRCAVLCAWPCAVQGPDAARLLQRLPAAAQWPRLSATPLFDFFFSAVHVNGRGLAQRHLLLNSRHWKNACKMPFATSASQPSAPARPVHTAAAGSRAAGSSREEPDEPH